MVLGRERRVADVAPQDAVALRSPVDAVALARLLDLQACARIQLLAGLTAMPPVETISSGASWESSFGVGTSFLDAPADSPRGGITRAECPGRARSSRHVQSAWGTSSGLDCWDVDANRRIPSSAHIGQRVRPGPTLIGCSSTAATMQKFKAIAVFRLWLMPQLVGLVEQW